MKILGKSAWIFLALIVSVVLLNAQKTTPPVPPQTARQALLEIIKGGPKDVVKHLTVEVQQLLSKPENSTALASMGSIGFLKDQAGGTFQSFETGPVLFSLDNPKERVKFEIRIDNDDLEGDEDTLELSIHNLNEGQDVPVEEWTDFVSHLTVTMVRQQNVWRLSKFGVGVELPFGDPEFLKKLLLKPAKEAGMAGAKAGSDDQADLKTAEPALPAELPPSQLLVILGFAEQTYAGQHPDAGFTCSLSELVDAGKRFMPSEQIATGIYGAYKINLTGCQGKPAGSFQITVEPTSPAGGSKAFCTDATRNVRVSDDGQGATCLTSGRAETIATDKEGARGIGVVVRQ